MYVTFYTQKKFEQISLADLLNNPFMSMNEVKKAPIKKVTVKLNEAESERFTYKRTHNSGITALFSHAFDERIEEMNTEEHYRHFEIPKKSNPKKKRKIDAPDDELSLIQTYFKTYIEDQLSVLPHKAAHAYVKERSTITAMQEHQNNNSKWYLQLDLKDFFNSITGDWLKKMLKMVYPFQYIDENSNILTNLIKISLLRGTLPQGSHLSPTLTNLAMVPIDYEITEKLHNYNKHHFEYTRYADDMTISCKEEFNPDEIVKIITDIFTDFETPFKINEEKTRFGNTAGRNYHLGIIVNKNNQLSVGHEKNQKFRAMLFNFCTVGEEWEKKDIQRMLGQISYFKSIEPDFVEKVIKRYNAKFNIDIKSKAKSLIA